MPILSKKARLGLLVALTLIFGVLAAQPAEACCVYNDTGATIKFAWHMASDWRVPPHDKKCDPGKGGKLDVVLVLAGKPDIKICVDIPVDDHGWVTVHQNENTFTVKSFRSNSTVKVTCSRTIDAGMGK